MSEYNSRKTTEYPNCLLYAGWPLVRPLGANVVREAQAVNQFGFSSLWTFLNEMKRGGNARLWMEGDRLRLFQWHLHWYFYWLWMGVSKWLGGFVIWKKVKILINHHKFAERCFSLLSSLMPRSHQSLNMFKSCSVKHGLILFFN